MTFRVRSEVFLAAHICVLVLARTGLETLFSAEIWVLLWLKGVWGGRGGVVRTQV